MPTGIQGAGAEFKDNVQVLDIGRLRVQIDEEIDYLDLDKSILFHLMSRMKKQSVGRITHEWQIQERKKDFVAVTGGATVAVGGAWDGAAANNGTFAVATTDAFLFAPNDVFMMPTLSETRTFIVVSVVLSTGVITALTVDALPITITGFDTANLWLVSNSFEHGSGVGTIKSEKPFRDNNHIQIIQTPMGVTTTARHLNYRGIKEFDKQKLESMIDHAFKIEKNIFFGQRETKNQGFSHAGGIYQQAFMGGVRDYISTHIVDGSAGALTKETFTSWVIDWTQYNKMPIMFSGAFIFEALTIFSETKLEVQRTEDTLGMAVSKFLTPYGDTVMVIPHRELLKDDFVGHVFGLDMSDLQYRFLDGLDTHVEVDVQAPGVKQKIDEARTWASMKIGNEKRHGLLSNFATITP